MAVEIKTDVILTDDHDGTTGEDVKTRSFHFNVNLELSDENYAAYTRQLAELFAKARQADKPTPAGGASKKAKNASPAQAARNKRIRDWARSQGETVSDRGRPSNDLEARYVAANPQDR